VRLLVCEERSMAEVRRMTGMSDREVRRRAAHGCDELRRLLSDWAPVR
jgi:DNA-directed RNA polymerase specialized sigma24 family protein